MLRSPRRGLPVLAVAAVALQLFMIGCGSSAKEASKANSAATTTAQHAAPSTSTPAATPPQSTQSTSTAGGVVTGSLGSLTATLHAGTHHPKVGQAWPIHFTASSAGHPVKASVSYEYLFGGQVVAHRSHYTFTGRFSDVFRWPSSAVGYPLTFRAVIVSAGKTINLDYPVQVTA